jgi:putative tryptophan/tyrosine transport system substrate-binding protein
MSEAGYIEGSNVTIEYRFAESQYDRLPTLSAELVNLKVAVIAATGGGGSVVAAKAATTTIPIVFTSAGDPAEEGYVASFNRANCGHRRSPAHAAGAPRAASDHGAPARTALAR